MKRYRDRWGNEVSAVFFDGTNALEVVRMLVTLPDVDRCRIKAHRWVILHDSGFSDVMKDVRFRRYFIKEL